MATDQKTVSLDQIVANRHLIEMLYGHGQISRAARDQGLVFLSPHTAWGMWVSRLLLMCGAALILSGIVYFFAFNWQAIPAFAKLALIQGAMIICLAGAAFFKLQRLSGQICLLSASLFVGVFMAVFGQIYQTGADAYQLFMMWSLLTFGWTVISCFAAQWIFWLSITNLFIILGWQQAVSLPEDMAFLLFTCLAGVNGIALALREYGLSQKGYLWLAPKWVRVQLALASLVCLLIPIIIWIIEPEDAPFSLVLSAMIGLIGHGLFYYIYRHCLKDMWVLAATILSVCLMAEAILFKFFFDVSAVMFLVMGGITLGVFAIAIQYLRKTAKQMEAENVA